MAKAKETEEQPADSVVEETQPTGEEQEITQPTEDLQAQVEALRAEAAENLELYKGSQRKESKIADREHKQDILDTLPDILDAMKLQQAETWDEIQDLKTQRVGETGYDTTGVYQAPQPPLRERRADQIKGQIDARKQVIQPKVESQIDPEDLRASVLAQGVIDEMGWDMEHPSVKKTLHLDDPKEALKILRKEQKTQRDKEADETVQQKLKASGVTTPETGGPSGGKDIYSREAIAKMSDEDYAKVQDDLWKALGEGKLK